MNFDEVVATTPAPEELVSCSDLMHGITCTFTGTADALAQHQVNNYHWAGSLYGNDPWAVEWGEYDRAAGGNWRGVPEHSIRRVTGSGEDDWIWVLHPSDFTESERELVKFRDIHNAFKDLSVAAESLHHTATRLQAQIEKLKEQIGEQTL